MNSYDATIWGIFILIGLATTLPRASFIVLGNRVTLPSVVQRALRYAPAAALSALVMPDLLLDGAGFDPFNPKLAAGLVVVVVATRWRNPWLPFLLGMGVLLLMRKGLGW